MKIYKSGTDAMHCVSNLHMKRNFLYLLIMGITCFPPTGSASGSDNWKEDLISQIPFLGHRNWIVITDMAYPLQTKPGIKTFFADESYIDILTFVYNEIEKAPHIKPIIYQDKELSVLTDRDAKGIDKLKKETNKLLGKKVISLPHEELIKRLDEVSQMFSVIIIKSNLTIPYTSTFFELDCNYWDEKRQKSLNERMESQSK